MNAEHINIGPVLGTDVDIVFKILGRTQENGTIAKNYEIVPKHQQLLRGSKKKGKKSTLLILHNLCFS